MQDGSRLSPRIVLGPWERLGAEARGIRFAVFIVEQGVPAEMELDDYDAVSLHAMAYTRNGTPVATGRLLPDGHIGRIAVLKQARGAGVGGADSGRADCAGAPPRPSYARIACSNTGQGFLRGKRFCRARRSIHGGGYCPRCHDPRGEMRG